LIAVVAGFCVQVSTGANAGPIESAAGVLDGDRSLRAQRLGEAEQKWLHAAAENSFFLNSAEGRLVRLYSRQGRIAEARERYRQQIATGETSDPAQRAVALAMSALLANEEGDYRDGIEKLRQLGELQKKHLTVDDDHMLTLLAFLEICTGAEEEGKRLSIRAIGSEGPGRDAEVAWDPLDDLLVQVLRTLRTATRTAKPTEATSHEFVSLINKGEKLLGTKHPNVLSIRELHARVLERMGQLHAAAAERARARQTPR
jgi:tetratricopeptide (TPR) repeat protein